MIISGIQSNSRCVALINGSDYFELAKDGKRKDMWSMEFESILYVPGRTWAKKHEKGIEEYPHITPVSYETGSNREGWGT